jgi:hypothetical protein
LVRALRIPDDYESADRALKREGVSRPVDSLPGGRGAAAKLNVN